MCAYASTNLDQRLGAVVAIHSEHLHEEEEEGEGEGEGEGE